MMIRPLWGAAAALCLALAACMTAPSAQAQVEQRERVLLDPLKSKYSEQVMGFDFKGTTVDISIDANAVMSMDPETEDALKADALTHWKSAWAATHPGTHATVTVHLVDFRGAKYANESAKI